MALVAVDSTIEFKSSQLLEVDGYAAAAGRPARPAWPSALQREGDVLPKLFCPPYYKDTEEAVLAFVAYKFAPGMGTFRDGGVASSWKDAAAVQAGIPNYPDRTIAATIAYCHYVHRCYGRFPGSTGSFCTVLATRRTNVDTDFYDRFYRPEAMTQAHRQHPDH